MFTGLIQRLGRVVENAADGRGGRLLAIDRGDWQPRVGESIAVNGTCLTVASLDDGGPMRFEVGPETVQQTVLGELAPGDAVNLEPALRLGDSLGGHFVTGHVDAIGVIAESIPNGQWQTLWFQCPAEIDSLLVRKGSIAVDGVSLTLVDVEPGRFSVMLIPHTLNATTLGIKKPGDRVNLETDMIARHVQKLFSNLTIEI